MSRKARKKSPSSIYHVILRGNNKQIIFEEPLDFMEFIDILEDYKYECNFGILAFCLMNNHIHLLMREGDEPIGESMRRIEVKFVKWYNSKYERCGNLFQERFKSEVVDNERYLLTVFRYILQNPIKQGLEKHVGEYKWTSFDAYFNKGYSFVETDILLSYFGNNHDKMYEFISEIKDEECLDYDNDRRLKDDEAVEKVKQKTGFQSPSDFQTLSRKERNELLLKVIDLGLPERQISRLTGISRGTIRSLRLGYIE